VRCGAMLAGIGQYRGEG